MTLGSVRPRPLALTDEDARELLAPPLRTLCNDYGPTRVGQNIGIGEKAVRDGRDEKSLIGTTAAFNLLLLDTTALNPILARYGLVAAPIEAGDDEDDAYFAELEDELVEVLSLAAKSRRAVGRLCHRTKAAMLKGWDRASRARAKIKRIGA